MSGFLILKLACKLLFEDDKFCNQIGKFTPVKLDDGDDPVTKNMSKEEFDDWLAKYAIDSMLFWEKLEEYLRTNECKLKYNFEYNDSVPVWNQNW